MTSTIFYNGKSYACEFIKSVSSEDIKGNLRIYASRNDRRIFLVTEFNEVLATEVGESYQLDAILDDEDCNHVFYLKNICIDFGHDLDTIIRTINNPLPLRWEHNNKRKMEEIKTHQQEIESTRVGGFGGSDAAMFLRIAKKGGVEGLSNTDLYRIAVAMGIKPYAPVSPTEAMQNGHIFEDAYERMLKERGEKNFEREVKLMPHILQMQNFAIFAHADFVIYTHEGRYYNSADYFIAVEECKFIKDENIYIEDVAETYKAQLQWYYLLRAEYVYLIRGYGDPMQPNIQRIEIDEDEEIINQLKEGIRLLDEAISDGWVPEIEEEYASAMSEKMQNIIADYERLKFKKSTIEEKLDELQKQIVEYMTIGNVAKINGTLGTISRTADSVIESFDSTKFKKENAELYNKYLKKSTRKGSLRYTINK